MVKTPDQYVVQDLIGAALMMIVLYTNVDISAMRITAVCGPEENVVQIDVVDVNNF